MANDLFRPSQQMERDSEILRRLKGAVEAVEKKANANPDPGISGEDRDAKIQQLEADLATARSAAQDNLYSLFYGENGKKGWGKSGKKGGGGGKKGGPPDPKAKAKGGGGKKGGAKEAGAKDGSKKGKQKGGGRGRGGKGPWWRGWWPRPGEWW